MENNQNYNENNNTTANSSTNNANTNSAGTNNANTNSMNMNAASDTANTEHSQQESSSAYGYSYINQEHKNPNNIWRADENTAHAYGSTNAGSAYDHSQAYGNGSYQSQSGAGSYGTQSNAGGYGTQSNTGSYGTQSNAGSYSTQSNTGSYGAQSNTSSTYDAQSNTGSAYDAQSNAGSTYSTQSNMNGTYSQSQSDTKNAYDQAYSASGSYGSAQPGSENKYSSIYGSADQPGSFQSYSDEKKQKKEERARKRAERQTGSGSGFGIKLAKCASIALIFGLVAGTSFEGSSYLVGSLLGTNEQAESDTSTQDREVLHTSDNTDKTTAQPTSTVSDGVEGIVEEAMPSIVAITNLSQGQYRNFFGQIQSYEQPSAGSGIIVSEDGEYLYIATNNHVVSGATSLTIQFNDGKSAAAEIKGTDKSTDLAVVKVKKSDIEPETLAAVKVATLGDSDVKVGSRAIAIGNALGYGQSVTVGYISAVDREVTMQDETTNESFTNELIQTDAAINPGNSGGALLNVNGEVIGINSSKYSDTTVEGMGFAIPSNTAKQIIEDLITKEKVSDDKAAYLGIYGEDVTSQITEAYNMPEGVFVKEVVRGSAAEQYGIKAGDIITQFDGKKISLMETLQSRLAYYEGGAEVEIVIQRPSEGGYEEMTLTVVLGHKNS